MQTCRLHHKGSRDCILFMAGWGMGPQPFLSLPAGGVDVVMVYDYQDLSGPDLQSLLPDGAAAHLLAWSMGVWAAARLFAASQFSSAVAVGGTLQPVDDRLGIPGQLFDNTIHNLSPGVLRDFYGAMFEEREQEQRFLDNSPDRAPEELRDELASLRSASTSSPQPADIYTRHVVTARDRIFPARNQIRAWGRDNCTVLPLPHFPFYHCASWAELLEQLHHD